MSIVRIIRQTLRAARRRVAKVPGVQPAYRALRQLQFEVMVRATDLSGLRQLPTPPRGAKLTVILLSYGRPRNIQRIAERVLRCSFVDRLVISNNNPAIRLNDFLHLDSPRLEVINQATACRPLKRFELARDLPGEHFLALDDDVFLLPKQLEAAFRGLLAEPATPRGVIGQVMGAIGPDGQLRYDLAARRTAPVDVLNRVYFFTAAHRDRFFELLDTLYAIDPTRRPLAFGDDVVLSFSGANISPSAAVAGATRPMVQDVGHVLYCPSGDDPAVARWLEPGFQAYRSALYRDLIAITGRTSR